MKTLFFCTLITTLFSLFTGCKTADKNLPALNTVPKVELEKYLGLWYEIARIENTFQKECVATTALYEKIDDEYIKVTNKCRKKTVDGEEKTAVGKAWVVDTSTNAKLQVSFFWPFRGDYWVIDLAPDYKWAVVGEPGREYLWILSREPKMDNALYDEIIERIKNQRYDTSIIMRTSAM